MGKKHKKDPDSWLIKRNRKGSDHINSCSEGYDKSDSRFCQVHHIVCVTSMADGTIAKFLDQDDLEKIRKCLAKTNWDINDTPNVVGLPLKRAFVDKQAPADWDGWPCHQVDHPGYTDRVSVRLNDEVWQNCLDNMKNCDDGAEIIASALNAESQYWLSNELRGRPTKAAWEGRFNPDGSGNPLWFWPFSMNLANPSPRKPPPNWSNFSESMISLLSELFKL
jgi:A nuclease family of the HNH/ENDO VII superfamily with conserved AHH